ncbi:MAG TPA: hypothetical protein VF230_18960 [Acidimicrobiales bacterium]
MPRATLPLSTLLSHALVAYTIEFDNEFEERSPHIATVKRNVAARAGPWLVSQVMWTNFVRFVADGGTPVRELQARAWLSDRIVKSRLHHLEWWSYLTITPDPSDMRTKPRYRDHLVHLTPGGRRARDEWRPLNAVIDKRWRERFGADVVDPLLASLRAIASAAPAGLPDYLPVVDYGDGMRATLVAPDLVPAPPAEAADLDVSALLSRALLVLTQEFEAESNLSLTIAANVLRVVDDGGTPQREIPLRAGVAKEGVSAAVNFLAKNGFVTVAPDKSKVVRATKAGAAARDAYAPGLAQIETRWASTFGAGTIATLRTSLEALDQPAKGGGSLLAEGLQPHAGGWRAMKPYAEQTEAMLADPRAALPHHPMVLHRGGYPDGA